jgi:hypothetical protein
MQFYPYSSSKRRKPRPKKGAAFSPLRRRLERTHHLRFSRHKLIYIGGEIPSLPTVTRLASNVPSGVLVAPGIKILAFGFSSLRSPPSRALTRMRSDVRGYP